ncbi:MAG TPA: PIN domain-containing protein [Syntrophorhabdaceae bacterium]|jgi:hypothetical protein|nr:hypothetical protein [Syntrophorhabdaceae bacterium]MDI9561201.1 PIN domain-containing protein [Pseudomonadota bacterium]OQC49677.1 MAG: hypothetical protein BWX58_00637 [Deltaproteobacteria bacterium ADurb.Bin026]MBP8697477.1 hypothetical protein [Syntrophorhabdaceae bacterium]MBV6504995.1 hypothetical protein [Syntrophorhabdaceae bacterium]
MQRILLIDFENVQKLDLELINLDDTEIAIFVGKSQNRIPFTVVEKTQALGERVRWLKIAGDGKNNLDFHIAFELGRLCERFKKDIELIILSMDSGYDALMKYINDFGIPIKRISNLAELADSKEDLPTSKFTGLVVSNLKKIDNQKRPRTSGTLKKHIESLLRDKANTNEIDLIIEEMFIKGLLTQTGNRLKYDFDAPEK